MASKNQIISAARRAIDAVGNAEGLAEDYSVDDSHTANFRSIAESAFHLLEDAEHKIFQAIQLMSRLE